MKKKAGIDFGLTGVKAYWFDDAIGERTLSSTSVDRKGVAAALAISGVTDLSAGGNGPSEGFERFTHHRLPGDPLGNEVRTQALGARRLLLRQRPALPDRFYLVSIGTGTSYTLCDGEDGHVPLLGSAIGAGTVDGLLASMSLRSGPGIDALLDRDAAIPNFDLMLVEVVPALKGTPYEAFVASHFAKAARHPPRDLAGREQRFAASAVNLLLVDVTRSLLLHDKNPECSVVIGGAALPIADVVVLGTMPTRSRVVQRFLGMYLRMIGKEPLFLDGGEYALALGAYHAIDP